MKVVAMMALLFPFALAADCTGGSCASDETGETSFVQVNVVKNGQQRSTKDTKMDEASADSLQKSADVSRVLREQKREMRTPSRRALRG